MNRPTDRLSLTLTPTLRALAVALAAGSFVAVASAQPKDPKAGVGVVPAPSKPATKPGVQPTAPGAKPAPANPKTSGTSQPAAPPAGVKSAPSPQPVPGPGTATPASPPGAQPAAPAPGAEAPPELIATDFPPAPPGWFRFGPFAEPVDVKVLVDMVADRLKVQIISSDTALRDKKIQLYTPVDVQEDKLIEFLGLLLEQNGQFIRHDPLGFYVIGAYGEQGGTISADALSTTQILPTRGLKPSSLTQAIAQVLRGGPLAGTPGQSQQINPQGMATVNNIAFLDDLGVLVMTDTPRRIAAVRDLITQLSNEQINLQFTRFEVRFLSAAIAKQRMLEMLGQAVRTGANPYNPANPQEINQQVQQQFAGPMGAGVTTSNLASRLIPDPQTNSLNLRGRPEEIELVQRLLTVVDAPNQLVPKWYGVGPAAQALGEQGKRAGLGDVVFMQSTHAGSGAAQNPSNLNAQFYPDESGYPVYGGAGGRAGQGAVTSGPVFVIDADQRGFMYYGTPEQHAQLEKLVKEFGEITQAERVVYEFYKLKFVDAEKTSDLIRGLINNTIPGGQSPLLPGGSSAGNRGNRNNTGAMNAAIQRAAAGGPGVGEDAIIANEDVFVLPDKSNNQVVVKAPQRLQPQFARLINKLDLRRPQVYLDAKIIVVSNRENFQLAVESQLINAGGTGGALRTLFSGSTQSGGDIVTRPTVGSPSSAAGGGIVAAVIKSDMVPLVIRALAQSDAGRIVASPQLLVDDNEEAEISSISQEPTTKQTANTTGGNPTVSFDRYEEAGPRLKVTPRLSTGDLMSMEYEVELSSFTAPGSGGIPPPKQTNNIKSKSVTMPSDSTIVVGGLEFSQKTSTVLKVPLLGDIPLIGEAFKSRQNVDDRRTVYVFITPRIMRDPIGNDLRYISEGPARRANAEHSLPQVKLDLVDPGAGATRRAAVPAAPAQPEPDAQPGLGTNNPVRPPAEPTPLPGANPPAPPSSRPGSTPSTEPLPPK